MTIEQLNLREEFKRRAKGFAFSHLDEVKGWCTYLDADGYYSEIDGWKDGHLLRVTYLENGTHTVEDKTYLVIGTP